jgi:hypothetical protein
MKRHGFALAFPFLLGVPLSLSLAATRAEASVSIAVSVAGLVQTSTAVALVTAIESKSGYEGQRIFTYTHVLVDRPIAGDIATGADVWIRSEGGIVEHVGMHVDGEPALAVGKSSLLFLLPAMNGTTPVAGLYEVTARGQGQFPVVIDAPTGRARVIRSATTGVTLKPKTSAMADTGSTNASSAAASLSSPNVRLAGEALHNREIDDVAQDIAHEWATYHPAAHATH